MSSPLDLSNLPDGTVLQFVVRDHISVLVVKPNEFIGSLVQIDLIITQSILDAKLIVLNPPPAAAPVVIDIIGGIRQFSNIDFVVNGDQIQWNQLALDELIEIDQRLIITYQPLQ